MKKTIKKIRVGEILVDKEYQRDLNNRHVKNLREEWTELGVGAIVCSQRSNGDIYVIDGQHRVVAKSEDPGYKIPAIVYEGLTEAEEAKIFVLLNDGRKSMTPLQIHDARIVEGVRLNLDTEEILKKHGLKFGGSESNNVIRAVTSCLHITEVWGKDALSDVLEALSFAWKRESGATWNKLLIEGVSELFSLEEVDRERLQKTLAGSPATYWLREHKEKTRSSGSTTGHGQGKEMARVIATVYNKGLRGKRRIEL